MGLDPEKIKYLSYFLNDRKLGFGLDDIKVIKSGNIKRDFFTDKSRYSDFFVVDQWKVIKYGERE